MPKAASTTLQDWLARTGSWERRDGRIAHAAVLVHGRVLTPDDDEWASALVSGAAVLSAQSEGPIEELAAAVARRRAARPRDDRMLVLSSEAWGAMPPPRSAPVDEVVALIRPLDQWTLSAMSQWGYFGEWDGREPSIEWAAQRYRHAIEGIVRWVDAMDAGRCRIRLLGAGRDPFADLLARPGSAPADAGAANPRPAVDFLRWLRQHPQYRSAHAPWADILWTTWAARHSTLPNRLGLREADAVALRTEGARVLQRLAPFLPDDEAALATDAGSPWSASARILAVDELPLEEQADAPDERALAEALGRAVGSCAAANRAIVALVGDDVDPGDGDRALAGLPPRTAVLRRVARSVIPSKRSVARRLEALHDADLRFRTNTRRAMAAGAVTASRAAELAGLTDAPAR
jgi:hypothetical protein